ncbi:MAG: DnaJ domain-containing protein [Thiomargarita sp.]|nr:DnaJ domain-containing protein [Thiomargarita sp.]
MKTPFEILEVDANSDDITVKTAYLKKVRQYPPEQFSQQFKQIRAAFESIQNKDERLKYQLFNNELPELSDFLETGLQQITNSLQPTKDNLTKVLVHHLETSILFEDMKK